ncbi:unnamed protein product [Caenorhabditis angaria]|uniref:Uncharacterized protein n=1 Tax=Caenorhabditis angaria TaxID=860376 RepID=A0A9P1IWX0_9PELO|nr:unnamed protein product [Caenorhabditis angaria]
MLGYFNRTYSELQGTWKYYAPLFIIEALFIFMTTIFMLFWIYVINTAQSVHRNVRFLYTVYYGQYCTQTFFWIIQPISILLGIIDDTTLAHTKIFKVTNLFRHIGLTYAFYSLPGFIVERSFATWTVQDYEHNPYPKIGNIIVIVQSCVSLGFGSHFSIASNTIPHIFVALMINSMAVATNFYIAHINKKYYNTEHLSYSLSERFQITENLRSSKMFERIVYSTSFFNVIVNTCMILDNYEYSIKFKNLSSVLCDFSILIYGFIVPLITGLQQESWMKQVYVLMSRCSSKRITPSTNSFTQKMEKKTVRKEETTVYFDMLNTQWK